MKSTIASGQSACIRHRIRLVAPRARLDLVLRRWRPVWGKGKAAARTTSQRSEPPVIAAFRSGALKHERMKEGRPAPLFLESTKQPTVAPFERLRAVG